MPVQLINLVIQCMFPKLNVNYNQIKSLMRKRISIVSSRVGTPVFWGNPPPLSGYPLFLKQIKKVPPPPLSESHPNWCMQIVRNTLKWRCYILYYTKSTENIITVFLTQIISHREKNADTKVALSISRWQKWNSRRQF